jgi:putative membrane protein
MGKSIAKPERSQSIIKYFAVILISLIVQVSVLSLLDIFVSGLTVETLKGAILFILILGLANSLILPLLVHYSIRFHPVLFPILVFLINGFLIIIVSSFVPGVIISSVWTAIGVSLVISMTSMIVGAIFSADDYGAYDRFVIRSLSRRYDVSEKRDSLGIIFLEIDGLSEAVLEKAFKGGYMPTIKGWLDADRHRLVGWETDLSCQTGWSQPGILHGNNANIPAFRWHEKDNEKLLTSEKPKDVVEVEKRISDGKCLLAYNGASRANMYSGDATESILTISTLGSTKRNTMEYFLFYANPYMAARTFAIFISHFIVEVFEGWRQIALNQRPRISHTGFYPSQRATTTGILRELSIFSLVGDMLRGLPAIYATFVGYDEVAHHSGVARNDALRTLNGLDKMFAWLQRISMNAARPYKFVVLSDHGQSNGATFLQ